VRYRALACDYDGTLATDSRIPPPVLHSLESLRGTGRKLILVTGRQLLDLMTLIPNIQLFDRIVAENGAVLYRPASDQEITLAVPPSTSFLNALAAHHVQPLQFGRVIIATHTPQELEVVKVIKELGLEMTLSFNKGGVMILPAGVNKGSGLTVALAELGLAPEQVVAVGDAENDHTLLEASGVRVAVANAVPALKQHAQIVTTQPAGEGVRELIEELIANDLKRLTTPAAHSETASPRAK
jgi:phosphoglycolate phosphatase (TIGR01487 family)